MAYLGTNLLITYNCQDWKLLNNQAFLRSLFENFCHKQDLEILNSEWNSYTPAGNTGTIKLNYGHILVYTWPEEQLLFCDIFLTKKLTAREVHHFIKELGIALDSFMYSYKTYIVDTE